jgi:hypothetical protein
MKSRILLLPIVILFMAFLLAGCSAPYECCFDLPYYDNPVYFGGSIGKLVTVKELIHSENSFVFLARQGRTPIYVAVFGDSVVCLSGSPQTNSEAMNAVPSRGFIRTFTVLQHNPDLVPILKEIWIGWRYDAALGVAFSSRYMVGRWKPR